MRVICWGLLETLELDFWPLTCGVLLLELIFELFEQLFAEPVYTMLAEVPLDCEIVGATIFAVDTVGEAMYGAARGGGSGA